LRREKFLLAALLVVAAALRLAAGRGELWLDEIWSLSFARELTAPWEVLTSIHHDNNHPLNTFSLFLTVQIAGAHAASAAYRILPLLTGIATIPLLFWTERNDPESGSHVRAWLAALLGGFSFLGIVYSSEARGYAPAAFFAVLAFSLVRRWQMDRAAERVGFAAVCALGLLSHLTFLFVYAGLLAWTAVRCLRHGRFAWRSWMALHRLPLVFVVGVYLIDARKLVYGGGPPFRALEVLGRALSLAVGGPASGSLRYVAGLLALSVILWGISDLVRQKRDEAAFFAGALLIAPASVLLFYNARFLDVRYFFVLLPFLWLLGARALTRISAQGILGPTAAASLVVASLIGGFVRLVPLLRDGRGHYAEAVAMMVSLTHGTDVTVGSDSDFRNRLVLGYYAERLPPGKAFVYVASSAWTPERPEWVLTHSFDDLQSGVVIPSQLTGANGKVYYCVQAFTYGGISGWNWYLYRRQDGDPTAITRR